MANWSFYLFTFKVNPIKCNNIEVFNCLWTAYINSTTLERITVAHDTSCKETIYFDSTKYCVLKTWQILCKVTQPV